jgi:MFS family permease
MFASGRSVIAPLLAIYVVSQLLRTSLGVIAPDLAVELQLSAVGIGLLSSTFFIGFAVAQIPLGMAIDRFGPRLCLLVGAAITAAGATAFALAEGQAGLVVSRALMGIGTAGSLMAPLTVYSHRFPPQRFATLTGLQLSVGMTGTLLATAPLGFLAASIGWRASFLVIAALTCCVGMTIFFVLQDDAASHNKAENFAQSLAGIAAILRISSIWRLFAMNLVVYSSFGLIAALWGGPYLAHTYGFGLEGRGALLLIAVIGQILGSSLWGTMDCLTGSYRLPVACGAILTAMCLGILAWCGTLPFSLLIAWLFVFGVVSAYSAPLLAHGKAVFAHHQLGRGLTLLNLGTMGGAFLTQIVSGAIISTFPTLPDGSYELSAYQYVFGLQALLIALCLLAYLPVRDAR